MRHDNGENANNYAAIYSVANEIWANKVRLDFAARGSDGVERTGMSILSTGNVGIGTTDPSLEGEVGAKLTILSPPNHTGLSIGTTDGIPAFAINPLSNHAWTMYDYASGDWTSGITQASGYVGIGTTSPDATLHVQGSNWGQGGESKIALGDSNHYIKSMYDVGVQINTFNAGDGIFLQEDSGKVGIGTTNPQAKLDVNGDIRSNGNAIMTTPGPNQLQFVVTEVHVQDSAVPPRAPRCQQFDWSNSFGADPLIVFKGKITNSATYPPSVSVSNARQNGFDVCFSYDNGEEGGVNVINFNVVVMAIGAE